MQSILRYRHSGWSLASGIDVERGIDEHVQTVLSMIDKAFPVFIELCERYDAELACVIYIYGGDRPAVHLSADVVKKIARLGAQIDFDLYVLPA